MGGTAWQEREYRWGDSEFEPGTDIKKDSEISKNKGNKVQSLPAMTSRLLAGKTPAGQRHGRRRIVLAAGCLHLHFRRQGRLFRIRARAETT